MTSTLTIGKLARAARVNVETVRYYQRRGLLPKPSRPLGGIRRYPPATLDRLRFIKRAQQLGFTLREIGELFALGEGSCRDTRLLAESKVTDIERRLRDLKAMRDTLTRLIRACRAGRIGPCPIIESLGREEP
jgi:MerR family mercuric resistance operon transcriptional regulator